MWIHERKKNMCTQNLITIPLTCVWEVIHNRKMEDHRIFTNHEQENIYIEKGALHHVHVTLINMNHSPGTNRICRF